MKKIFFIVLIFISLSFCQDYIVDDYHFSWKVFQYSDIEISVIKTEDDAYISLKGDSMFGTLNLTSKEAIEIGEELSNTNSIYKKFKKNDLANIDEEVKLSSHQIKYKKTEKLGFYITIRTNAMFSSSVSLERKEALAISQYLIDAESLINYINQEIDLE